MRRGRDQRSGVACEQAANPAARNAGFTLIELLLVLGLLVTVTSLVMPAMGRGTDQNKTSGDRRSHHMDCRTEGRW